MKNFTQGILFGVITGGLIALLNSPNSGEVNRRKLKSYLQENTDSVKDLTGNVQGLQQSLSSLSQEGMATVNTATKEVTASLQAFTEENSPRIKRVMRSINKLTDDLKTEQQKYEGKMKVSQTN